MSLLILCRWQILMVKSFILISEATDKNEYERLRMLYSEIRDVVYRITESENLILQGLEKALANTKQADDLPF